ncbi:MAG: hypothetical protein ACOY0T_35420 [Myxococcota bacterium]
MNSRTTPAAETNASPDASSDPSLDASSQSAAQLPLEDSLAEDAAQLPLEDLLAAEHSVEQAELAVLALLAKLRPAPRAEKVTIGAPLETALERLRAARTILSRLSDDV